MSRPLPSPSQELTPDFQAIRRALQQFLNTRDEAGRVIGSARCGVYAFYDYDSEPIYVGQTYESLRARIGRHLTNQRTDAVAMRVLDPMEVARVEVWPIFGSGAASVMLGRAALLLGTALLGAGRPGRAPGRLGRC